MADGVPIADKHEDDSWLHSKADDGQLALGGFIVQLADNVNLEDI